jgi:hypothetical protein
LFHYLSTVGNSYRQEQEDRLGFVRDETQSGQLPKREGRSAVQKKLRRLDMGSLAWQVLSSIYVRTEACPTPGELFDGTQNR